MKLTIRKHRAIVIMAEGKKQLQILDEFEGLEVPVPAGTEPLPENGNDMDAIMKNSQYVNMENEKTKAIVTMGKPLGQEFDIFLKYVTE